VFLVIVDGSMIVRHHAAPEDHPAPAETVREIEYEGQQHRSQAAILIVIGDGWPEATIGGGIQGDAVALEAVQIGGGELET